MQNNWLTHNKTLIIGHRGASADAPENTLKAFALAKEQGAEGIEFDVRIAKDGEIVVIHDDTLDRTCTTTGNVRDFTSAELQQVDAGDGEFVPTLDQLFELCGSDFLYNVEIKDYDEADVGTEAAVYRCIERHNMAANCTISSFGPSALQRAQHQVIPNVAWASLRQRDGSIPEWFAGQADHPHWSMVNQAYMDWAVSAEQRIHVWTVDDVEVAKLLVEFGVNALITNKPAFLREALGL